MFLKCVECSHHRIRTTQLSCLRQFRTSSYLFLDKDRGSNQEYSRERYVQPKKKSFFDALKGHSENNLLTDKVPEKESIGSLLKVQRANQNIPDDFKTVYKFPLIQYFALVNRLKVYHTVLTGIASLGSIIFYACGILSSDFILVTAVLGFSGCLMFYSLGYAAARFIGFIYYNEKTQIVRIAYVDSWGRRRDLEVALSDIMRRDEAPVGLINKVWFPLRRYSTKETLKLQLEQGIILDQQAFKKIL